MDNKMDKDKLEEDKVHKDEMDEDKMDEDKVDDDKVDEDKVHEDNLDKNKVDEDRMDEDNVEEDKMNENKVKKDKMDGDKVDEDKMDEDKVDKRKNKVESNGNHKENHIEHNEELTDAEAELYDRQIRLWGLESQKRLRAAKVLLIGASGFGAEIAKNIILAGIKSLTFLDHREVTQLDKCAQFFVSRTDLGKNRAEASLSIAQSLNSMVEIKADTEKVDAKPDEYFAQFDVVCATNCSITELKQVNQACRKYKVKFFAGDVWGSLGYTFADLMEHEFAEEVAHRKKVKILEGGELVGEKYDKICITEKHKDTFVPFECILNVPKESLPKNSEIYYMTMILLNYREKYGKDPLPSERSDENIKCEATKIIKKYKLDDEIDYLVESNLYAQISPVCAIIGGIMAQELIKAVSLKGTPNNNFFVFDSFTFCGKVMKLGY